MLELLGDECDLGNGKHYSYEIAWGKWWARQRELASQYEVLTSRTGIRFCLEDIDINVSAEEDLDGARLQPSAAEFMAYITVDVVTNIELEAASRSVERSQARPTSDGFSPDRDENGQIPAGLDDSFHCDAGKIDAA